MKYPWIQINPLFKEILEPQLNHYKAFLSFEQGQLITVSGTTKTIRFSLQNYEFYLKTYTYPKLIWRYNFLHSRVHYEWESLQFLKKIGLNTPTAIAYGEDRGRLARLKSCFIMTEGVPDSKNMDHFVPEFFQRTRNSAWRQQKNQMITQLAEHTATMHNHYFIAHDFFWRNILIQENSTVRYSFIDCPKGEQAETYPEVFRKCRMNWGRIKDLASLDKTAPDFLTRVDRLRFLKAYLAVSPDSFQSHNFLKQWLPKIHDEAEKLRKRSDQKKQERLRINRQMLYAPSMQLKLQENGMIDYPSILLAEGEKVSSHGTRKVLRKTLQDGSRIYIKVSKYPHLKNTLPLKLKGIASVSRFEKENLDRIQQQGFPVPEFVVLGEKIEYGLEQSSFLVLKELPQAVSLEKLIAEKTTEALSLEIPELALFLRKFHHCGFYHQDLYTKHLLRSDGKWFLIDLQRLKQIRSFTLALAAQDLAALYCTCQQNKIPRRFYVLFLRYYFMQENKPIFGEERTKARTLLKQIRKRVRKLIQRKKIQPYFQN
ncbi:MAG: lipopolysaccharide kinase InaA family protein [Planctomycetota bacterium]